MSQAKTFEEYLKKKRIDPEKYATARSAQFAEFKALFDQVHPDSFTAQKLFLINKIRRAYPYQFSETEEKKENASVKKRPVMRRKAVTRKKDE